MYKKMKYMLYVSLFLVLTFMTTAVLMQNQNINQKKNQQKESKEFEEVKQRLYNQEQVSVNTNETTENQNTETDNNFEENNQTEYIDITENTIEKTKTEINPESEKKALREKEQFLLIKSPEFETIDTEKNTPIMEKYLDYTAIATNLTKSSVLFFIFDKDLKVVWQKRITNTENSISPESISILENKVLLNIQEKSYNNAKSIEIEFENYSNSNNNINLKLKNIKNDKPIIQKYPNKTLATEYNFVEKIKYNGNSYFYIIAQKFPINNTSKTVYTKFYVYKEENDYLRKVYNLFESRINKEENPANYIQAKIENNNLYVRFNNNIRAIPVSILNRGNSNITGDYLCISTNTKIENSNTQISIKDKDDL